MNALLVELTAAPAGSRARTATVGVALGLALAALVGGAAAWRVRARGAAGCDPTAKLANVWETAPDGRMRRETRAAFLATANDVPDARERFERVGELLDGYAQRWAGASREACETARRAADGVTGLRTNCLDWRRAALGGAHRRARPRGRQGGAPLDRRRLVARSRRRLLRPGRSAKRAAPPGRPRAAGPRRPADRPSAALRASAAAGHDWQSLEPVGALVEDVRAAGYDPLLVEALLVDARIRSPFIPRGPSRSTKRPTGAREPCTSTISAPRPPSS